MGNNTLKTVIFSTKIVKERLLQSAKLKENLAANEAIVNAVLQTSEIIAVALKRGGKVLICGNGGSASDALHFCGEIVGRFQKERKAASAISLNADVATMTAVANDYGYDIVFERSVQAHMRPEDIFIGISTSGNSINVLKAVSAAKHIGGKTIGLLGKDGGEIAKQVDIPIVIPCNVTARIQECHICLIHIICELVEETLSERLEFC